MGLKEIFLPGSLGSLLDPHSVSCMNVVCVGISLVQNLRIRDASSMTRERNAWALDIATGLTSRTPRPRHTVDRWGRYRQCEHTHLSKCRQSVCCFFNIAALAPYNIANFKPFTLYSWSRHKNT